MKHISRFQLRRLQTLYSVVTSRELGGEGSREARLSWAAKAIGRTIASFSDLDSNEANQLIDTLQAELGQASFKPFRRISDRDRAQAAGTEGRKRSPQDVKTIICAEDFSRINDAVARLGWTREQLEAWLASSSSPLKGLTAIRTLGDANRVWWALKNMLKREGKWKVQRSARKRAETVQ